MHAKEGCPRLSAGALRLRVPKGMIFVKKLNQNCRNNWYGIFRRLWCEATLVVVVLPNFQVDPTSNADSRVIVAPSSSPEQVPQLLLLWNKCVAVLPRAVYSGVLFGRDLGLLGNQRPYCRLASISVTMTGLFFPHGGGTKNRSDDPHKR